MEENFIELLTDEFSTKTISGVDKLNSIVAYKYIQEYYDDPSLRSAQQNYAMYIAGFIAAAAYINNLISTGTPYEKIIQYTYNYYNSLFNYLNSNEFKYDNQ